MIIKMKTKKLHTLMLSRKNSDKYDKEISIAVYTFSSVYVRT